MSKPRTFSWTYAYTMPPSSINPSTGWWNVRPAPASPAGVISRNFEKCTPSHEKAATIACRPGEDSGGSWFQYEIPFRLQVTAFSFGFSDCSAKCFKDWTFEAFDGEEWRELYYSMDSPWIHDAAHRIPGSSSTCGNYRRKVFILSGAADFTVDELDPDQEKENQHRADEHAFKDRLKKEWLVQNNAEQAREKLQKQKNKQGAQGKKRKKT